MIGPDQPSPVWQRHPGDVCVLPAGAIEQHDAHLPLNTDLIIAEAFARLLGEGLGAALLPAMPVGTSFEHTGFRGSLSLRPETAMAVVRDLADEVERQAFRVLIILNGHGGNFSYGPVVRDINRRDRPLKILLIDWWTFVPAGIADDSSVELHSGEMETSVMLALRPDLVGERRDSFVVEDGAHPLVRSDLNTFGIGHMNPSGSVGFPSFATADKGRAVIEAVRTRMLPFVRDRIGRLREQPRYAGAGGVALRTMTESDVAEGMRLKTAAGWNQTEADWRVFLRESPDGCFVVVRDGTVLGTVATIRYGVGADQVAWISMVLVDPAVRRGGIGTRLLEAALARLADCACVKLDATPAGRELYLQRGFVDERRLARWSIAAAPANLASDPPTIVPATAGHLSAIEALDRPISGLARGGLLRALHVTAPAQARVLLQGGAVRGFVLGRPGTLATQIGPIVAPDLDGAKALAAAALRGCAGRPAFIDALEAQPAFTAWLASLGFASQRPLIRMRRGAAGPVGDPAREFAIAGPEFG